MMPASKTLRQGAGVKPGDTVEVVMEGDGKQRSVEASPELARVFKKGRPVRER